MVYRTIGLKIAAHLAAAYGPGGVEARIAPRPAFFGPSREAAITYSKLAAIHRRSDGESPRRCTRTGGPLFARTPIFAHPRSMRREARVYLAPYQDAFRAAAAQGQNEWPHGPYGRGRDARPWGGDGPRRQSIALAVEQGDGPRRRFRRRPGGWSKPFRRSRVHSADAASEAYVAPQSVDNEQCHGDDGNDEDGPHEQACGACHRGVR